MVGLGRRKNEGVWKVKRGCVYFIGLIVEPLRSEKVTCGEARGEGERRRSERASFFKGKEEKGLYLVVGSREARSLVVWRWS